MPLVSLVTMKADVTDSNSWTLSDVLKEIQVKPLTVPSSEDISERLLSVCSQNKEIPQVQYVLINGIVNIFHSKV